MKASRFIVLGVVVAASLGLAACDKTVRGVGQDIRDTGQAVEQQVN
ncbi:entericidin A/B family lipoprotein [Methylobrevis albus]|uniref:Entericidin A/B family lipoprotein n=1 Tax=Methylobrevis albus TaxID=2793297 RepID=A0A931I2Y5_9HYPH|nr:entericidin A/B family lipoprotein [Methylobrevis albus]MBH0239282.1 entericidin A/B family lipoprotein [Methylobrevis albus]